MPAITAVELGPDTCVLVRASIRGAEVHVIDVEILDPAAFPGNDAFIASLRQSRRKMKLPRRARVVLWGLPDGGTPRDSAVQSILAPLASAGFRVQRVVSPCNALAALARIRTPRPDGAVGWLAVDRAGVAIVVARPGALLYSHAFPWDSSVGATGSQARMLQRYSLVAFLAPELRRAIAAAQQEGARVDTIITCGNLPDLRSLTMPLIEELDLEVETLDSLDGLTFAPEMRDRLTELAPAIRMACAGAATRATRPAAPAPPRPTPPVTTAAPQGANAGGLFRAAALLVAVGGIGWWWYSQRAQRQASPVVARVNPPAPPASRPATSSPAPQPSAAETTHQSSPRRPEAPAPAPSMQQPTESAHPKPAPPAEKTPPPPPTSPPVRKSAPAAPPPSKAQPTTGVKTSAPKGSLPAPAQAPPLLDDPLPQISMILASGDRPFAMIGGRVVIVGDRIGQRVVTGIESRTVVFREPSGVQIRVGLGGRFLGVKR